MPVSPRTAAQQQEEWRDVPGAIRATEVSNFGRVMQCGKIVTREKINVQGRGQMFVYWLVLEAFIGRCPDGMEACHYDDDRTNNSLSNLRWDTRANNTHDSYRNGASRERAKGEKQGIAKLTTGKVVLARLLNQLAPGVWTTKVLGGVMGVTRQAIRHVLTRKNWRHVL